MELIKQFSDYFAKIGVPNFLAVGIVIIAMWLMISGLKKGLRKNKDAGNEKEE